MSKSIFPDTEKPGILHISYDFGDPARTDKTTAVLNLVNQTAHFADVYIIDLKRITSLKGEEVVFNKPGQLRVNSFGLPFGIFHTLQLKRAYNKILKAGGRSFSDCSLIHAHKLTFEGYIGYLLSEKYNKPLFITLRQTDFAVLRYRPDLRKTYFRILKKAAKIFYLVPIMLDLIKDITGPAFFNEIKNKFIYLPNIVEIKKTNLSKAVPGAPMISILRFTKRSVKRKNIKNLLKAFSLVNIPGIRLKFIGGGEYLDTVKQWVKDFGLNDKVEFTGEIPNSQIDQYYAQAGAFIMPSFSESFGLVYAESLLNGTPILYSKGVIGFDGVFQEVGEAVDPQSVDSIKRGIENIVKKNAYYRKKIITLKQENGFNIFSPEYAKNVYMKAFDETLKEPEKKLIKNRQYS